MKLTNKLGHALNAAVAVLGLTLVTLATPAPEAKAGGAIYWNNGGNGAYVRRGGYILRTCPGYYNYGPTLLTVVVALPSAPTVPVLLVPSVLGCVRY